MSFGQTLRRGFGFRLGIRLTGPTALLVGLFVGMFYLMWWTMLAAAYVMWGAFWLSFQFCRWLLWEPLKWLFYTLPRGIIRRKKPNE